jgi:histidyl-tRNA synthetase
MKFQKPFGTRDLFELELKHFQKLKRAAREIADFYGFRQIETPVLENVLLFKKSSPREAESLQKQLFLTRSRSGEKLALRLNGTLGVLRAYLEKEHEELVQPLKFWYFGPFFRDSLPREREARQFFQLGFEVVGSSSWITDALIIQIFYALLKGLGLKNLTITVNSAGDFQCRPYYKKILANYFRGYRVSLCADCRRKLRENPLKVFNCGEEKCQRIVRKGAPQILDHLCKDCHSHFKNFLEALDELEVPYTLDPYLIQDFDYYTRTVFKITQEVEGEDDYNEVVLAKGGRYDTLIKLLGGKETPACGGALEAEKVLGLVYSRTSKGDRSHLQEKVFLAQVGELSKRKALKLVERFRREKIKVAESLHRNSLSFQLKLAEKLKVRYVLILGQKESLEGKVILRDIEKGTQKIIGFEQAVKEIKKKAKR